MIVTSAATGSIAAVVEDALLIRDSARSRDVPIYVYKPSPDPICSAKPLCPVALVSGGYGESHRAYSFLANALTDRGFLVVSVQHDLPGDAPLPIDGDLFALRAPYWTRGSGDLFFVRARLRAIYPGFNWEHPVLVGHSNGGDISVWFTREHPHIASAVITLDHRRVPMLRSNQPKALSLRGTDYPAAPGVLPSRKEQSQFDVEVIELPDAKHNDMVDSGPDELKRKIIDLTVKFLEKVGLSPGTNGT